MGWLIIRRDDGTEFARSCECREREIIERLFNSSEITDAYRKLTFDNFTTDGKLEVIKKAKLTAWKYKKEFGKIRKQRNNSIALLGNPGAGKTHLLMALSNALMNEPLITTDENGIQHSERVQVLYFPWEEVISEIKSDFKGTRGKVEKAKRVNVLFIDDLFKGDPTKWEMKQFFEIMNYRYINHLPILLSSEWKMDELVELDQGIGSRLLEMCDGWTVHLVGEPKKLNHRLRGLNG